MEAHDLTSFLSDRDLAIRSLQHFKARENIILRRPASIRVEVMSPIGVALVVAADAGEVEIFDPGKNTLMQGPATAATLQRYARIPMTPDAAVRLMLALAPDSAMMAFPPNSMTEKGDAKVLTYHQPGGTIDELGFTGEGNLEMVRETLADRRISYEVHYSNYKKANDGFLIPFQIDASFPKTGATVKFHYQSPSVNQDVSDSAFTLVPSAATKKLNLGMRSAAASDAQG
jgi:hypothetical protein